jgi:hypothetical protein
MSRCCALRIVSNVVCVSRLEWATKLPSTRRVRPACSKTSTERLRRAFFAVDVGRLTDVTIGDHVTFFLAISLLPGIGFFFANRVTPAANFAIAPLASIGRGCVERKSWVNAQTRTAITVGQVLK